MRTFRRLLGFLAPYRKGVYWSFALAFAAMGATVAIPWLTGRAIDAIRSHHRHTLTVLAVVIVAAAVARLVLSVFRRLVAGRVSLAVEYDLRAALYGHLQRLELGFFDRQQTGQLMSRATVDLQAVRFFLGYGLVILGQALLTIVLAAAAMFAIKPGLAAISLAPVPFVILIADRYGRRSRPAMQEVQQRLGELTAEAEENVSGVRVVKAFAREQRQFERFRGSATRVFDQAVYATRLEARYSPMISFLPNLGLAAILLVGGRNVIHGSMTVGDFTAFYAYLLMLIHPMATVAYTLGSIQRATASGARIFELLDRAPRITDADGATDLPPGHGRVELVDVGLTFEGAAQPALQGANLVVEPGSTVALVGATGSGKTALVSLLGRLYDATTGSVRIDGADVTTVRVESLRRAIATVNDDPFLFSATVHDNIAYARAHASRDEVQEAARRAQADEFIRDLPEGYDTVIGERGLTLSGGQRQRIAIARAILADPRILVLDDATSSVDASTEQEIKLALQDVMAGRTTFVISHRPATIAMADEIVVLDGGRITDAGTHAELMERSPGYRALIEVAEPEALELARRTSPWGEPDPEVAGL